MLHPHSVERECPSRLAVPGSPQSFQPERAWVPQTWSLPPLRPPLTWSRAGQHLAPRQHRQPLHSRLTKPQPDHRDQEDYRNQ